MKTAPAFQFYASDTMADKRYRMMTLAERGLYLSLLSECWVNRSMPAEPSAIARWLGCAVDEIKPALTERVLSFFIEAKGELTSPDLERYRTTLEERREKQSKGGRKGAKGKWDKPSGGDNSPNSYPNGVSMAPRVEKSRKEKTRSELAVKPVITDPWIDEMDEYEQASNGE